MKRSIRTTIAAILVAGWLGAAVPARADGVAPLQIPVGQIGIFEVPEGILTFASGDSKVALIQVMPGNNRIGLITALSAGVTNVLIWSEKGAMPHNFLIEVLPNRRSEQIVCRVKVVEIITGDDGKVGIDWFDRIGIQEALPDAAFKFGLPLRTDTITATLNTLIRDRKAKLLAQPTLMVMNGETAQFTSGGQIPYATIGGQGQVNVQFQEYGTRLKITGQVQGTDTMKLSLAPEVSDLDKGNSVSVGGINLPALSTRKAETTVQVRNGESIVLAGLLQDRREEIVRKLPLLGDIPFLGNIFRSNEFRNTKTELVFIVTPTIHKGGLLQPEGAVGSKMP
ncbi:MAG: pilus assembly protein N-terminal domain-containing protein [Candidatus Sericytochromatia bacterium]|nr:pilus assembly protein N-terminal domain-containing protein [Candidatus Sericytochromatia bacterium]